MSKMLSTPWWKDLGLDSLLKPKARCHEACLKEQKHFCTLSVQRLMCSEVKKGSCLRYESLDHMAWVTIWANSIAASAGLSHPLLDSTSTQAWIRRTAWKHNTSQLYTGIQLTFYLHLHIHHIQITFLDAYHILGTGVNGVLVSNSAWICTLLRISSVSDCSSALSCILERWACSNRLVFTWGSLNLGLFSLCGTFCANWNKKM